MPSQKVDENEFQNLTDHLPAAVFVQVKGRFAHVNQEFLKVLGESDRRVLEGRPVLERIPRHRWPETTARISRTNRDRQRAEKAEQEMIRADGSLVAVEISSAPYVFGGVNGALVFVRDLTEEKNFRNLVSHLPIGVFIGTQGTIVYANPEAVRLLGAAAQEQLVGTPVIDRITLAARPGILEMGGRVIREGAAVDRSPIEYLRLDGSPVSAESSAVPFRFEGRPGTLVFLRDLTAEREARQNLEVKERLLRLTGALAKVGGWEFDPATGEGTWTDEVARIHDVSPLGTTNVAFGLQFYTPESRARIEVAIRDAVEQALPYDLVLELVTDQGRRKWVRTQGTPVQSGGRVVQVRGTFQDITEIWEATRTAQQEQEKLAVTLKSIGDGVITTDTVGRVALMSRTAEELTGWSQAEAAGRPLTEVMPLIHEWTKRPLENPVDQVLRDRRTIELAGHTVLVSKDGRERLVADSAAPICDAQGDISGVVLVFRDMTEKQKLAEALQRAQNLESIGLLAAGIAHDFNNLLSGLFGQIQLAADKVHSGKVAEAQVNFDRALGVFDRAKDLTGQLLTFSKGGSPVRTPCDLPALVKRTVLFALAGSNVGVAFDLPEELPPVAGDPNQLAQAIDNLVINARQAMAGGGTLQVKVERRIDARGTWAVIHLQDQGPGIPEEALARIFDPFYTTKPGGHGLGLAAVQSILQRHEGRVEVESAPGRGACFRLYLPSP